MIVDDVQRLGRYAGLLPGLAQAAAWLDGRDLGALVAEGDNTVPLVGERLLAMPQTQPLKPRGEARWEAHRRYADVQVCVGVSPSGGGGGGEAEGGAEGFGWCPLRGGLPVAEPHDGARDVTFYAEPAPGSAVWFDLHPGQFALFLPEDVHAPCLGAAGGRVQKVVLKVEVARG